MPHTIPRVCKLASLLMHSECTYKLCSQNMTVTCCLVLCCSTIAPCVSLVACHVFFLACRRNLSTGGHLKIFWIKILSGMVFLGGPGGKHCLFHNT